MEHSVRQSKRDILISKHIGKKRRFCEMNYLDCCFISPVKQIFKRSNIQNQINQNGPYIDLSDLNFSFEV